MTSIDFYFNAADRLQVACRLAGKALAQGKRTLLFAPDTELAQRLDRLLWTWPATGFVPHCAADDPLAAETPVLIAREPQTAPSCEILLNLAADCPPLFERYERLLEVVTAQEADRRAGRARYLWYRDRGYQIRSHDLARAAT
ncbi:MAG: DNA polymerase III subunit chi [Betaproteobacteria bacterium]|nr:DNA polymerase III subunit chi [Betaproteobacteria bacterium]MBM3384197.1 DNA polymerase III subunit chi [Betaproteobacteria bacterium]